MLRYLLICFLSACSATVVAQDSVEVRDLVILAGQSNAVGFDAKPSELDQDPADAKVLFWWKCGDPPPDEHDSNSSNAWTHLQPQPLGDPIKPRRDRQYGNYAQADGGFGPEIGFARTWLSHNQPKPERGLAIIKTAFSGTGIGRDWNPDSDAESGACFRAMIQEINKATAAAKQQKIELRPRAFLWVQGESDANATDAPLYQQRLGRMLTVLREQLLAPELQVRIAVNTKFSNGNNAFMPAIVTAQQDYAASDPNTVYVDTSAAPIANAAHYDTAGTLLVGRLFAESLSTRKPPQAGEIRFEQCDYKTRTGTTGEYEVGTFCVLENRSDPDSRVISIGYARFRAQAPTAPPVFYLPGGPGDSFLESGEQTRLHKTPMTVRYLWDCCDVILVDQRGYSTRGETLVGRYRGAAPKPDQNFQDRVAEYQKMAESVTQQYSGTNVDLRGYTVLECVEDVNELRQALGYDKISLRGQSFGCQWSLAFMRKYPELVQRALLSGVEPLNHGYDMPSHVFAAVKRIWQAVDHDPRFMPYLPAGGMTEAAETVIKRLETEPITITRSSLFGFGTPRTVRILGPDDFPWHQPAWILELYHGHTDRWNRTRPRRGGTDKLIADLIDSSLGVTPERREQLWNDPAVRYLTRRNFSSYLAAAEIWPSPDVGDDFRTLVTCDIPVVFVNGDWDTNTPIENMHEITPFFPNSHKLVVHQAGHGTIHTPMLKQHPKVLQQLMDFLKTGSMDGLPDSIDFQAVFDFAPPKFQRPDQSH